MFGIFKKKKSKPKEDRIDFLMDESKPAYSGLMTLYRDVWESATTDLSNMDIDLYKQVTHNIKTASHVVAQEIVDNSMKSLGKNNGLDISQEDISVTLFYEMMIVLFISIFLKNEGSISDDERLLEGIGKGVELKASINALITEKERLEALEQGFKYFKETTSSEHSNIVIWKETLSQVVNVYLIDAQSGFKNKEKLEQVFATLLNQFYSAVGANTKAVVK
jgi:hypothetical protein